MTTRIFLRDDDVGGLTPELRAFAEEMAARRLPVSYQIIPERFTEECAEYMRGEKAAAPERVEFGQHGLRHQMVVRGKLLNHEFGPERTYAQQFADIEAGRELLRERLGDTLGDLRVFTPPRHRYNRDTLRAIKAAGFCVLSASSYTTLKHRLAYACGRSLGLTNLGPPGVPHHGRVRPDCGLFEMSVAVGVDDGHEPLGSVEQILERIGQARGHAQDLGVLFHHDVFAGDEGRSYLARVLDGLLTLRDVTFHTIGDLYDQSATSRAAA